MYKTSKSLEITLFQGDFVLSYTQKIAYKSLPKNSIFKNKQVHALFATENLHTFVTERRKQPYFSMKNIKHHSDN